MELKFQNTMPLDGDDTNGVQERRRAIQGMDSETMQMIAELASDRAIAKLTNAVYNEVGKTVLKWACYVAGVAAVWLAIWLYGKGLIK